MSNDLNSDFTNYVTDDWFGCYREGWGPLLTPRSYGHPAKLRFGLAARIYRHILELGWATAGSSVVDCFGGIGGTAFHAMFYGLHWTGVELEPRFYVLAGGMDCPGPDGTLCPDCAETPAEPNQGELFLVQSHRFRGNLDVWKDRGLPGTGKIIQGDSRQLSKLLADVQVAIASPPYGGNEKSDYNLSEDGKTRRRDLKRDNQQGHGCFRGSETYGQSEGQLGMMPATEQGFDIALISPPYADQQVGTGGDGRKGWRGYTDHGGGTSADPSQLSAMPATQDGFDLALASPPFAGSQQVDNREQPSSAMSSTWRKRQGEITPGTSDGQLAEMKDDGFNIALSSPPYGETGTDFSDNGIDQSRLKRKCGPLAQLRQNDYGETDGQIGTGANDFWAAAKQIVLETFKALLPGAHAVWVVKSYVKDSRIVDFPDQWRQLCESVGFKTLHEHRAWVVEKSGEQMTIDGRVESIEVHRKSFFRLLQERKGSPEINWETVWCMVKP